MKPIILFDNGHGCDCAGKCSPDALAGKYTSPYWFKEYLWCREIAQRSCDVLQAMGYEAWLLVPETNDVPLATRVKRVNDFCKAYGKENVILISIHNDAAGDGKKWMNARGWSIYTTKGVTEADKLAEYIFTAAQNEFRPPLKVRPYSSMKFGHDFEENFYILAHSYCPAVLVENFFQDNKEDVQYLKSEKGKGACIHVITEGIKEYIKAR